MIQHNEYIAIYCMPQHLKQYHFISYFKQLCILMSMVWPSQQMLADIMAVIKTGKAHHL